MAKSEWVGIVSDAADWGSGAIVFTKGGSVDPTCSGKCPWTTELGELQINSRETEAAIRAVLGFFAAHPEAGDLEVRIAIDNTTAEAWVHRGFCPWPTLQRRLDIVAEKLLERGSTVRVIGIDTDVDAADTFSRGEELEPRDDIRIQASWYVVSQLANRAAFKCKFPNFPQDFAAEASDAPRKRLREEG